MLRRLLSIPAVVLGFLLSPLLLPVGVFLPTGVRFALFVMLWLFCELLGVTASVLITPLQLHRRWSLSSSVPTAALKGFVGSVTCGMASCWTDPSS